MYQALLAILTGYIVGLLFQLFKMPLPAPQVFTGILGIFGIYLGGKSAPLIQRYAAMIFTRLNL